MIVAIWVYFCIFCWCLRAVCLTHSDACGARSATCLRWCRDRWCRVVRCACAQCQHRSGALLRRCQLRTDVDLFAWLSVGKAAKRPGWDGAREFTGSGGDPQTGEAGGPKTVGTVWAPPGRLGFAARACRCPVPVAVSVLPGQYCGRLTCVS